MQSPNFPDKHQHQLFCLPILEGNEMGHFREPIYNNPALLIAFAIREICNKIHWDLFPRLWWIFEWYQLAVFLVPCSLVALAGITGSYIVSYPFFHIWLVVVLLHKIQSLVSSQVPCDFCFVALVCYLQLESVAVWNIYAAFLGHHFVLYTVVLEAWIILACLQGIPNAHPMLIQKPCFQNLLWSTRFFDLWILHYHNMAG